MRPESSASTEDSIPPNPGSPSQFSEAITSASIATTPTWSNSPAPGSGQNECEDHSFSDPDLRPSTLSVDTSTSRICTRSTHSLPQTQTPEILTARPKSGARALTLDLPGLPESLESLAPRIQTEDHINRITDCPIPLSAVEASTASSALRSASLQPSSTNSEQSESEDASSSSSGPDIKRRWFSLLFDILASESSHRAKARENRIKRVIKLLTELQDDTYAGTELVIRRKLNPSQYQELCTRIEADTGLSGFFDDKLRYEYSYKQKQFIIYMPTAVHDAFARDCEFEIREMLKKLASTTDNSIIAKLAGNIRVKGGGRIQPPDLNIRKSLPDGSFQLRGCAYPGLVIEVAWSQENSDSIKKAERYFRDFRGEDAAKKKWFVDKDKDPKKRQNSSLSSGPLTFLAPAAAATSATFSVWRADGTDIGEDSVHDQVFRCESQQHNPNVSLVLSLQDFVCEEGVRKLCPQVKSSQAIQYPKLEISSEKLCEWFDNAIEDYRPQWELELMVEAQRRQAKKDNKGARLKKEATALETEKVTNTIGDRVRKILKGRVLRSAVQKEVEKNKAGNPLRNG